MNQFIKAEKKGIRLRMALLGPTGSGKSYWSLTLATEFAKHYDTKIAVIDSERGSAKKYADLFEFDVLELATYEPQKYVDAILNASEAGYGLLIIDSLSHAWSGVGGLLEQVDKIAKRMKSPNSFAAWREATPLHNELVNAILDYDGHLIVTMRSKMEYVMEKDKKGGRTVIRKVGLQPVQREGLEYEFDIIADLDEEHNLIVSKTRCATVDGGVYSTRSTEFVPKVIEWLGDQSTAPSPAVNGFDRAVMIPRISSGLSFICSSPEDITATIESFTGGPLLVEATDAALQDLWTKIAEDARRMKAAETEGETNAVTAEHPNA